MKSVLRSVKNSVYSFADIEVRVREATSNDRWPPAHATLVELSRATHDYADYPKLFAMLWKRLSDVTQPLHVTKALTVVEFLLQHASDRFVADVKRRARDIALLQKFKHYSTTDGADDGSEARATAKRIYSLLCDEKKLEAKRKAAASGLDDDEEVDEDKDDQESTDAVDDRQRRSKPERKSSGRARAAHDDDVEQKPKSDRKVKNTKKVVTAAPTATTSSADTFDPVSEEELSDNGADTSNRQQRTAVRSVVKKKKRSVHITHTRDDDGGHGEDVVEVNDGDDTYDGEQETIREVETIDANGVRHRRIDRQRSKLDQTGRATDYYRDVAETAEPPAKPRKAAPRAAAATSRSQPQLLDDDVDAVPAAEFDLLSLADKPQTVFVGGRAGGGRSGDVDLLTGIDNTTAKRGKPPAYADAPPTRSKVSAKPPVRRRAADEEEEDDYEDEVDGADTERDLADMYGGPALMDSVAPTERPQPRAQARATVNNRRGKAVDDDYADEDNDIDDRESALTDLSGMSRPSSGAAKPSRARAAATRPMTMAEMKDAQMPIDFEPVASTNNNKRSVPTNARPAAPSNRRAANDVFFQ